MALDASQTATDGARRSAAAAAFLIASTPVFVAIPILAAVASGVQRPLGADLDTQVAAIVATPVLYGLVGLPFLVLGPSVIVLAVALHEYFGKVSPVAMKVAMATGVIAGAFITVGGFGTAALAAVLPAIDAQDHEAAVALYVVNTHAPSRFAWTGMAMFGALVLLASLVGPRADVLGRGLSYLGVVLALLFVIGPVLPGPLSLVSIPVMVVWAAWLGITLRRHGRRTSTTGRVATA